MATAIARWAKALPLVMGGLLLLWVAACAPTAAPTPTPTKAAETKPTPPKAAETAPPKAEAKPTVAPTATTPAKPTGAPIKLGFITPLSGPLSSFGVLNRIAVLLARDDINETGGINGYPVEILIEDSPLDPKQAVSRVRKLAEQDKVFAIVGPFFSGEFEVAAPLANELKIPVASPSAVKAGVAAINRPWSFQMNVRDDVTMPATVDAFKKKYPNAKKVVITGDTKQSTTEDVVRRLLPPILKEKGYDIIATVPFEAGTTDFSAIVTKIKGLNAEGIMLVASLPESVGMAKELKRQDVKAPVMVSTHPIGGPFVESAGPENVEGWIAAAIFDEESPDPAVQKFLSRFYAKTQADPAVTPKPKHISTEASYYDALMIIADILRKGKVTADTPLEQAHTVIRDGLQSLKDYKGLMGPTSVNANGEAERQPYTPYLIQKGEYKHFRP